jgi:Protein phosphatase 2C
MLWVHFKFPQVSGNHRLDDNQVEIARVVAAGSAVGPSAVEGKPVGPLRVWPGGLAMSRSIGDAAAGAAVVSDPEVRQVAPRPRWQTLGSCLGF